MTAGLQDKPPGGRFNHDDALVVIFDITGATAFFNDDARRPVFNRAIERWVFASVDVTAGLGGRLSAFTGDGMIICWPGSKQINDAIKAAERVADLWRDERTGLTRQFADAEGLSLRAGMAHGKTDTVRAPTSDGGETLTIQGAAVAPAKHVCDAIREPGDTLIAAGDLPKPDQATPVTGETILTGKAAAAKPAWWMPL